MAPLNTEDERIDGQLGDCP